jgi:hypothetical protein
MQQMKILPTEFLASMRVVCILKCTGQRSMHRKREGMD